MNKIILSRLAWVVLIGLVINVAAAAPRSCEDEQVYLAVMESARRDLPAPYSEMDVRGSTGIAALKNGQCRMTLLLVGGEKGQKEVNVLYKTTVPLSQIRVSLEPSASSVEKGAIPCTPIRFKPGHVSATVSGSVEPKASQCFTVATGANQTMEVSVVSRYKNTVATIPGIGDARDRFEFLTQKRTYQIDVFQLMRSADKDQYSLIVTVR